MSCCLSLQKADILLCQGHNRQLRRARGLVCTASFSDTLVGVGLFFTPSILAVVYAFFKGKGNVKDGLSKMLTEVSQGYFQPDVGGENIPIAQGELSDLAGDEPLFKALYQWCDNASKPYLRPYSSWTLASAHRLLLVRLVKLGSGLQGVLVRAGNAPEGSWTAAVSTSSPLGPKLSLWCQTLWWSATC